MKPIQKCQVKKSAKALVDDLNAVRAVILDNKQQRAGADEHAAFAARFFESWVIDRLAQHECQMAILYEELAGLKEKINALQKSLQHPVKKDQKEKKKR